MTSNILDIVYISILSFIKSTTNDNNRHTNNEPCLLFENNNILSNENKINKRFENVKTCVHYVSNHSNHQRNNIIINRMYRLIRETESMKNTNLFVIYLRSAETELFNYIVYQMNNVFLREEPMMRIYMLSMWNGFQHSQGRDLRSLSDIDIGDMKGIMLESSRLLLNNYRFNHGIRLKLQKLIHDIPIAFETITRQQLLLFIKINSLFLIAIIFNWKNVF